MSAENKKVALDVYVLVCINHCIGLISTAFFDNEKGVLAEVLSDLSVTDQEMEADLADACSHNVSDMKDRETTTLSQLMQAVSKLSARHGDCLHYWLNKYEPLVAWMEKENRKRAACLETGADNKSSTTPLELLELVHVLSSKARECTSCWSSRNPSFAIARSGCNACQKYALARSRISLWLAYFASFHSCRYTAHSCRALWCGEP